MTLSEEQEERPQRDSELERLRLMEKNLHNFLFSNVDSLRDGHFYELRAILRQGISE